VAVLWAAIWTWLTTDVRRASMHEDFGPAPELAAEAGSGR
jgi:hypothetical protein